MRPVHLLMLGIPYMGGGYRCNKPVTSREHIREYLVPGDEWV